MKEGGGVGTTGEGTDDGEGIAILCKAPDNEGEGCCR